MESTPRTKIAIFLVLTFGFSSYFYWRILGPGSTPAATGLYLIGLMWCPGIAAIITRLATQHNLAGQGWALWRPGWLAIGYAMPLVYATPVYILAWASGIGGLDPAGWSDDAAIFGFAGSPVAGLLALATLGVLVSLVSATGEEIGWRGLLVPELAKVTGFRNTALISGAIWGLWHMPLIVLGDYNGGTTPIWFSVGCFAILVVSAGFVYAWIRLRSGSLWPAALLHASHNLFVQGIFDAGTADRGNTAWLTTEFGAGLALTVLLSAVWVMRRARRDGLIEAKG